jgi:hypothetical protein
MVEHFIKNWPACRLNNLTKYRRAIAITQSTSYDSPREGGVNEKSFLDGRHHVELGVVVLQFADIPAD